eukprot:TRINITY_DN2245_c0_g1_i1.p1 TRINITY_DN2245_c0_g1~~TRINITY_DN2245_c0_g1_i1.p1  ORF type:complete len:272 (-),score=80.63 TRINITY_DN2245_c0_g1_i1:149-964(-)
MFRLATRVNPTPSASHSQNTLRHTRFARPQAVESVEAPTSRRSFATSQKAPQSAPIVENTQPKGLAATYKELADQCGVEIQNIQEYETDSIHAETANKWLATSGFKLSTKSEKDDEGVEQYHIVMEKDVENTKVRVSFIPWEEDEDAEKDEDNLNPEGEDEQKEEEDIQTTQAVTITVHMGDKGEIKMKGFAGVDHRLYVRELEAKKAGQTGPVPSTFLSELSGDLQDKVYDFLDTLGVDDNLAFFVKQEAIKDRTRSDVKFLNTFRELLK